MRSGKKEATFQVNVVVKYSRGKYKRRGTRHFAYAVYGMDLPVHKTFKEYRKRFGVESSYKLKNLALPRTSTRNPVLRLLYIGLAFLLVNIWIYAQWMFLSMRRRGRENAHQVAIQGHAPTDNQEPSKTYSAS